MTGNWRISWRMPPIITPMASPKTGVFKCGQRKKTDKMMARFSSTGASAGAAKCPNTFRIPMHKATRPIKKI